MNEFTVEKDNKRQVEVKKDADIRKVIILIKLLQLEGFICYHHTIFKNK